MHRSSTLQINNQFTFSSFNQILPQTLWYYIMESVLGNIPRAESRIQGTESRAESRELKIRVFQSRVGLLPFDIVRKDDLWIRCLLQNVLQNFSLVHKYMTTRWFSAMVIFLVLYQDCMFWPLPSSHMFSTIILPVSLKCSCITRWLSRAFYQAKIGQNALAVKIRALTVSTASDCLPALFEALLPCLRLRCLKKYQE